MISTVIEIYAERKNVLESSSVVLQIKSGYAYM